MQLFKMKVFVESKESSREKKVTSASRPGCFLLIYLLNLFCLCFFTSCSSNTKSKSTTWYKIPARNLEDSLQRPFLYHVSAPTSWIYHEIPRNESIFDTKKANGEFHVFHENDKIRITIHTFPYRNSSERIPPQAQISRWKKQFDFLDPLSLLIQPESRGGFSGLYFEGQGKMNQEDIKMMAWAMQLANLYDRQLQLGLNPLDQWKRADYTIKVVGKPELIDQFREEVIQFAHHFEFIHELPAPS